VSILHAPVVPIKRILYMEREKIILPQYMISFPCFIKVNFAQVSAIINRSILFSRIPIAPLQTRIWNRLLQTVS
jgi:hypothetical protein